MIPNYLRNLEPIEKPVVKRGRDKTAMNKEANKILAKLYENHPPICEIKFPGCNNLFIAPCHKEFRNDYHDVETLASWYETIMGCQHCHQILDNRDKTTKEESDKIFDKLRPRRDK